MPAERDIIYLDNNSSTRIDPTVLEEMMPFLTTQYGNPSGSHRFGTQVKEATNLAHERVAAMLGCQPNEIVFTSGGTESDNTALHSALQMSPERRHVVTTSVEHNAVLNYCEALVRRGCEATIVPVDEQGHLDLAELERAIRPDTAVVSVMWANNETGVIYPLEQIAEICRSKGVFFHTDAVQVVGKMPINLADLPVHFLSLSGHKLHAPKGVGALYVNRKTRFQPLLVGGPQEGGRRAGTDNVASIVGLGKAAELAMSTLQEEDTRVRALRDRFETTLAAELEDVTINGDPSGRLPNTSNLAFNGVDAQAILIKLDQESVCCSLGSSCTTGAAQPSHVLRAMQLTNERARSSLRFSFGRFNTEPELDKVLEILPRIVRQLRTLSPAGVTASAE
ncbi:MAG: cysteine desulfurase NifS [Chthoniobacterales bacterium]|nr:cysteine desulfurase NifS [Chthoniobacterales bacterium]